MAKVLFIQRGKWSKTNLTYKFENFDTNLSKKQIRDSFVLACGVWTKYAPLKFQEITGGQVDIRIGFYEGNHECNYSFDNKMHFAHAFFPPEEGDDSEIAGDIHFNKKVKWSLNKVTSDEEIDFVTVAAHELGHALGLDHVGLRDALMHAHCKRPHRELHRDDIAGIQKIYGDLA